MDRRDFASTFATFSSGLLLPESLFSFQNKRMKLLKAPLLKTGSTIGLIAPASAATDAQYDRAVLNLEALGLKIKPGKHVRKKYGYLGGTDAERLADLHDMFKDDEVEAIWCVRGGYGCARLLPDINFKLIKQHPKMIIGYSDITALLVAIYQETGLVGCHGPLAFSEFTDYTLQHVKATIFQKNETHQFGLAATPIEPLDVIHPGTATGRLTGGNLSLLASMMGTPYQPKFKNHLVFIEDVGEKPYRIDRMLTQLLQGGLGEAAGILLGTFADCKAPPNANSLTLSQTLHDRLGKLNIPVVYGLSFGHVDDQFTLPVGVLAELKAESGELVLLESPVS